MSQLIVIAATVAGVLSVGLAGAPIAKADQYEYVADLDNNGVYYTSMGGVIDLGKQLCRLARSAPTNHEMAVGMSSALKSNGITSNAETEIVISAAVEFMCPDTWPRIKAMNPTPESTPVAANSTIDEAFLRLINERRGFFTNYGGPDINGMDYIATGRAVCGLSSKGFEYARLADVVSRVLDYPVDSMPVSIFIALSVRTYCPPG